MLAAMSQWLTISRVALQKRIRDGELPSFDGMVTVDEAQRKRPRWPAVPTLLDPPYRQRRLSTN